MGRKYGRVLVVDLGERSSRTMEVEPEILKRYMGGAGLAAYLYSLLAEKDARPLDAGNPFFFNDWSAEGNHVTFFKLLAGG